jgi:predicted O-methyltransferase YrrM
MIISNESILQVLDRLHREASQEMPVILMGLLKGVFRKLKPEDMKDAYISMSRQQGRLMYEMIVENQCRHIVEFGTSFGISTLYLAAGAKVTGGKVITTELLPEKCTIALENFRNARAMDVIELREGDALLTLANCSPGIDFLLLDGWNDLYLPLLKMLEPRLKKGCIIITDNTNFPSARLFLKYIRNNPSYQTQHMNTDKGGTEKSIWLG